MYPILCISAGALGRDFILFYALFNFPVALSARALLVYRAVFAPLKTLLHIVEEEDARRTVPNDDDPF